MIKNAIFGLARDNIWRAMGSKSKRCIYCRASRSLTNALLLEPLPGMVSKFRGYYNINLGNTSLASFSKSFSNELQCAASRNK